MVLGGAVRTEQRIWRTRTAGFVTPDMLRARLKGGPEATPSENTTLVVVVTDAVLTKSQAKRLAMIAQTGMARAIYPVHAPTDGDVVYAAATGKKPIDPRSGLTELGMVAAKHGLPRDRARSGATALPSGCATGVGRSLRLGRSPKDLAGSHAQALTESDAVAPDEIAWACRWIICSMKL